MVVESSKVQGSESIFLLGVHQLPGPGQNLLYGSTELDRLLEMEEIISASPAQELSMSMFYKVVLTPAMKSTPSNPQN